METREPYAKKNGYILAQGNLIPTTLPVRCIDDWDKTPSCFKCGRKLTEKFNHPHSAAAQDGYHYTWFCMNDICRKEHIDNYIAKISNDEIRCLLKEHGIPDLFVDASFSTMRDQDKLVEYAQKWATHPHGNLFISGDPGCGKTHLAVSILRNRIEAGQSNVFFKYIPDLILDLRHTFNTGKETHITERDIVDRYAGYRILVLDDLGAEKSTEYTTQILDTIIDRRIRNGFPTVVTSNLNLSEVEKLISERLSSRLSSGKVWTMRGRDWRRERRTA